MKVIGNKFKINSFINNKNNSSNLLFKKIASFADLQKKNLNVNKIMYITKKFHKTKQTTNEYNLTEFNQNITPEQKKEMKKFTIFKYDPSESNTKELVTYHVDLKECGPMVLDALIYIKDEIDPTLSFRRSCREGICGSCSMNIDGRNTLACLSYIEKDISQKSTILPLPYFTIVRDLVVDMTNFYTQYKSIVPVLKRKTEKVSFLNFKILNKA